MFSTVHWHKAFKNPNLGVCHIFATDCTKLKFTYEKFSDGIIFRNNFVNFGEVVQSSELGKNTTIMAKPEF
jgi:hypothetical protein